MASKTKTMYVDPEKFEPAMLEYREQCLAAKAKGEKYPNPSDYICKCIIDIADGVGKRHNFRRYSFLDEMKLDAIENAIRYLYNFDPERGSAFTFISDGAENIFKTRIGREERQRYFRCKTFDQSGGFEMVGGELNEDVRGALDSAGITEDYQSWMSEYERKQEERRNKVRDRANAREAKKREGKSITRAIKKDS